jgi:predicted glycoside hydrolase/deacetylase ChbG (UPF0249 family)
LSTWSTASWRLQGLRDKATVRFETSIGSLILNADDWGRDRNTTDRTLDCVLQGAVSSVSAMVFMEDSERAASLARERGIDAGLHLNLTTAFSAGQVSGDLAEHQRKISSYLQGYRYAQAVFHPGLSNSFRYVVAAQIDEFIRLYGRVPGRIDGHHHMHLCANVLLPGLLPKRTIVRRNFTFQAGEKSLPNRLFRRAVDHILARRYYLVDFFFALPVLIAQSRLQHVLSLAEDNGIEIETHPAVIGEYRFLACGEIFQWIDASRIARGFGNPEKVSAPKVAIDPVRPGVAKS